MKINWFILVCLFLFSCKKEETSNVSPVKQTGDLEITVLYQQQPVANAEVTLFYTQTDLQRNQNPYRLTQQTNADGKLLWTEIEAGRTCFYIARKDSVRIKQLGRN